MRPTSSAVEVGLARARKLMQRGHFDDAIEHLYGLDSDHPGHVDIKAELCEAFIRAGYPGDARYIAEQAIADHPHAPRALRALILAEVNVDAPASALAHLGAFLAEHPGDGWASEARHLAARLEATVQQRASDDGIDAGAAQVILAEHERAIQLVGSNDLAQARKAVAALARRAPHLAGAALALARAEWDDDRRSAAFEIVRAVLARDPSSVGARALLVRFAFLEGNMAAAEAEAAPLRTADLAGDDFTHAATAYSWLGDDEAVLRCLDAATAAYGRGQGQPPSALLEHLAAVAAARRGDLRRARSLWRSAAGRGGATRLWVADDNLGDLSQPVAERHGPWAFGFDDWLGHRFSDELRAVMLAADDRKLERALRRLVGRRPALTRLVPAILDRGAPSLTELVIGCLTDGIIAADDAITAAVKAFVTGRRGSDDVRMQACQAGMAAGWLPSGEQEMWVNGRQTTLLLMGFEIHGEPVGVHPPRITRLVQQGIKALHAGDLVRAEAQLQAALEARPDAPDIRHNVAVLRRTQGRIDEALAMVRDIHARHPDYLFARTLLASDAALHGRTAEANDLLMPLLRRPRLHIAEFRALAAAHIDVAKAEGDGVKAARWRKMAAAVERDWDD